MKNHTKKKARGTKPCALDSPKPKVSMYQKQHQHQTVNVNINTGDEERKKKKQDFKDIIQSIPNVIFDPSLFIPQALKDIQ